MMYFNDKKEEVKTKIILREIKLEKIQEDYNITFNEEKKLKEDLREIEEKIQEMEEEKRRIAEKEKISASEMNEVQNIITNLFDLNDKVTELEKQIKKRKIKGIEIEQLLDICREEIEELKRKKEKM